MHRRLRRSGRDLLGRRLRRPRGRRTDRNAGRVSCAAPLSGRKGAAGREERKMRTKKEGRAKRVGGGSQREVLRDVMMSAAQCGTWLTLRELARMTNYGEPSISAQLRHLRKERYGAFVIDKQVRKGGDGDSIEGHG